MNQDIQLPPMGTDKETWKWYWTSRGEPWRVEAEISDSRKDFLKQRRLVKPDIYEGMYPFSGIELHRADIEWLLSTHEDGGIIGPIQPSNPLHSGRQGLDMRGSIVVSDTESGLRALPLARLRGALSLSDWLSVTDDQRNHAVVHFKEIDLRWADLRGAVLFGAHMEKVDLRGAHLEGAGLLRAHLQGADLRGAYFDDETALSGIFLSDRTHRAVSLVDVHWRDANIAAIDWLNISRLGDEESAHINRKKLRGYDGRTLRIAQLESAVRANRQLAAVLRSQGMTEYGDHFAYRAQVCHRRVLWSKGQLGRYLGSGFLDVLAGHGYRPLRSFAWYVLVVLTFAAIYYFGSPDFGISLSGLDALVLSMTSFHGRGFFPGGIPLGNPFTLVAAIEAFVGLIIEITLIATFTQRFFGK